MGVSPEFGGIYGLLQFLGAALALILELCALFALILVVVNTLVPLTRPLFHPAGITLGRVQGALAVKLAVFESTNVFAPISNMIPTHQRQ